MFRPDPADRQQLPWVLTYSCFLKVHVATRHTVAELGPLKKVYTMLETQVTSIILCGTQIYFPCRLAQLNKDTCMFVDALWSPAGKGLTSWLSFVMSNCDVVTYPLVSWVRCDAWLYRFLIFAPFLTLWCIFLYGFSWPLAYVKSSQLVALNCQKCWFPKHR